MVLDELQHVGLLGLLARRLDHDLQRLTVRQEPDVVGAPLGQPQTIEQLVGEIGIMTASTWSEYPHLNSGESGSTVLFDGTATP